VHAAFDLYHGVCLRAYKCPDTVTDTVAYIDTNACTDSCSDTFSLFGTDGDANSVTNPITNDQSNSKPDGHNVHRQRPQRR
jgi:hypothetical protein